MRNELLFVGLLLVAAPSLAADRAECQSVDDANLAADLAAWAQAKAPIAAAAHAAGTVPHIAIGKPATVMLHPAAQLRFARAPQQVRTPADAHGGILRLTIADAGAYRVSASTSPWIDVLRGGQPVASTAHGQLAPCTSIHKVVEFPLKAGDHLIQLSGNAGPRVELMVTKKP